MQLEDIDYLHHCWWKGIKMRGISHKNLNTQALSAVLNQDITEYEIIGDTLYFYTRHGGIARGNIKLEELDRRCRVHNAKHTQKD